MAIHGDVQSALSMLGLPTDGAAIKYGELQRAYLQLALKWHPDRNPEHLKDHAEAKMKEINAAHQLVREWLQHGAGEYPSKPPADTPGHEEPADESEGEPDTTWDQEPDWEPDFAREQEPKWEPRSNWGRTSTGVPNHEYNSGYRARGARQRVGKARRSRVREAARSDNSPVQPGPDDAPTSERSARRSALLSALVFSCGMFGLGVIVIGTVMQLASGIEGSFVAMLALVPTAGGITLGRQVRRKDLDERASDLLMAGKACSYIGGLGGIAMGAAFFVQWHHSAVFLLIAAPVLILVFAVCVVLWQIGDGSVWKGARESLVAITKAVAVIVFLCLALVLPDRLGRRLAKWLAGIFERDSDGSIG